MGVNPLPTGGIYKYFSFDGVASASFGVHLTGTGVFNAPTRAIEMVNIPARNGAFPQDMGYFENIEVTYTASIVADNESDYADAVSDLRNWLCSRKGYCRLEDDYNPNEYRMAVYKSGLEVDTFRLEQGEFDIVFDCKPQRFLKSGETAIAVTSGDTITNSTFFEAKPTLELSGYGNIYVNGQLIKVASGATIGRIKVGGYGGTQASETYARTIDTHLANNNDVISIESAMAVIYWGVDSGTITSISASSNNPKFLVAGSLASSTVANPYMMLFNESITFAYGTSSTVSATGTYSIVTSAYGTVTGTVTFSFAYNGSDTITVSVATSVPSHFTQDAAASWFERGDVYLNSTKSALGNPLYVDLETGEAYNTDFGDVVPVNSSVSLPAELPTLVPGANTVTYNNTFTQVKIVPRWWTV